MLNHRDALPPRAHTPARRRQREWATIHHRLDDRVLATAALARLVGNLGLHHQMRRLDACWLVAPMACLVAS